MCGRRMYLGFAETISEIMDFWTISMQGVTHTVDARCQHIQDHALVLQVLKLIAKGSALARSAMSIKLCGQLLCASTFS